MDPLARRVAARFIRASNVSRILQILVQVPAKLEELLAFHKNPFEKGKKLPKTKITARIDGYIEEMHKLLLEYQVLFQEAWKASGSLPDREKQEATRHLSIIQHLVPKAPQTLMIVKEGKPHELREKLMKAASVWHQLEALLAGQKVLFAGVPMDPLAQRVAARYAAEQTPESLKETLNGALKEAVKRIAATLKPLGMTVKYVLEPAQEGRYGLLTAQVAVHVGTASSPSIHVGPKPTIRIHWDPKKQMADLTTSFFVWPPREPKNIPEPKIHEAALKMADALSDDVKRMLDRRNEPESEPWSVVTVGKGHSYATEVDTFTSKEKAMLAAKGRGDCYVVQGTQMWNEPLGQVEEHDRPAKALYVR